LYDKAKLMKKILLISDTHGCIDDFIYKHAKQADEVWHAGDIGTINVTDTLKKITKLRAVYGNIDGGALRKEFNKELIFTVEEIKVFITHIGGYPGRYAKGISSIIHQQQPDIFISGHSHILKVMYDKKNNLLHLNPGAAGKKGFHKKRTMLQFTIDKDKIENLAVIERPR
jgi:putative phosphoesterase